MDTPLDSVNFSSLHYKADRELLNYSKHKGFFIKAWLILLLAIVIVVVTKVFIVFIYSIGIIAGYVGKVIEEKKSMFKA